MAIIITWELDIRPISLATKEASILAIRTEVDDIESTTLINIYEVSRTKIDTVTMANNIPILDEIWTKHQDRLARKTIIENFTSGLEAAGKSNLEARE